MPEYKTTNDMINKFRLLFSFIVLLAILAGLCFASYKLAVFVWHPFSKLDPALAAGIIAASATIVASILGSIVAVLIAKRLEQQAFIKNEHRKQVTPIYEEFIEFIFQLLLAEKLGKKKVTEQEMIKIFAKFTQKIVVWGSDDAIKAYYDYKRISFESLEKEIGTTGVFAIEDLMLALRRDLGHSNKGLKRGKILGLFVNDIHHYINDK